MIVIASVIVIAIAAAMMGRKFRREFCTVKIE